MFIGRYRSIDRIVQVLRAEGGRKVHQDYEQLIRNAEFAFCHQRIFDTVRHSITCLTPLPEGADELSSEWDFLGPLIPDEHALLIAKGKICPMTREPFVVDIPKPIQEPYRNSSDNSTRMTSKVKYPKHYEVSLNVSPAPSSYMRNPYIKELGKPRAIKVKTSSLPPIPNGQRTIRDFFAPRSQESNV